MKNTPLCHNASCSILPPTTQVDTDLMNELRNVKSAVKPTDTLLVVDAMTGQVRE